MNFVPSTLDHYLALYGEAPPRSFRALTAVKDGQVVGMAGVYLDRDTEIVFAKLTEQLRKNKRAVVMGARRVMGMIGPKVAAICDPAEESSARFLAHFGFRDAGKGVWVCSKD